MKGNVWSNMICCENNNVWHIQEGGYQALYCLVPTLAESLAYQLPFQAKVSILLAVLQGDNTQHIELA